MFTDAWYAAAWTEEVGRQPLGRQILGLPMVFYRTEQGELVALRDVCPHRNAPLSMGELVGDAIECAYHGFQFSPAGSCVKVPSQQHIPSVLSTPTYPVVERHGVVWVWPGDAELADESAVVDWPWLTTPEFQSCRQDAPLFVDAPAHLLVENLMDLTHVPYLHSSIFGSNNLVSQSEIVEEEATDDAVWNRWAMHPTPDGQVVVEVGSRYRVPTVCDTWSFVHTGESAEPIPGAQQDYVLHLLTPATETTLHYFVLLSFNYGRTPQDIKSVQHRLEVTILDDKRVCEAIWRNQQSLDLREHPVRADKAAVMARKLYDRVHSAPAGNGKGRSKGELAAARSAS